MSNLVDDRIAGDAVRKSTPSDIRARNRRRIIASLPQRLTVPVLLAILGFLVVLPMGILLLGSFLNQPPVALQVDWSTFGFQNYKAVFSDGGFSELMRTTLFAATAGAIGATTVGCGLAWLAVRTNVRTPRLIGASALMPLFTAPLIGAFAWDILGSPRSGILNLGLRELGLPGFINMYSIWGIIFLFTIYYGPYVYVFAAAALRNVDHSFEDASVMCGASMFRTTLSITLRLILPAITSASLLVLVLLLQLFSIPAVLGAAGQHGFMSVRIWELISFSPPRTGQASALGVVLLVITMVLVVLQTRFLKSSSYVTITGKSSHPRRSDLGRLRTPLSLLSWAYLAIAVVLPYLALILVGLRDSLYYQDIGDLFDPSQLSLSAVQEVLHDAGVRAAAKNTLLIALGTLVLGLVLYFAIAYVMQRTNLRGRRVVDAIAMTPLAIPAMITGLGFLWAWITLPIGIYGTLWILILAYLSQFLPQGIRAVSASLVQVHSELEEASRISGAGFFYTLWRIVVPLVRPGMAAAGVLIVVMSVREIGIPLFLYTASTEVVEIVLFNDWGRGATRDVAVLSLLQAVVLIVLVVTLQWVGNGSRRSPRKTLSEKNSSREEELSEGAGS